MPDMPEGSRHHESLLPAPVLDDGMTGLREHSGGDEGDARENEPQKKRNPGGGKGRELQEKGINHPGDEKKYEQNELSRITERVLAFLLLQLSHGNPFVSASSQCIDDNAEHPEGYGEDRDVKVHPVHEVPCPVPSKTDRRRQNPARHSGKTEPLLFLS